MKEEISDQTKLTADEMNLRTSVGSNLQKTEPIENRTPNIGSIFKTESQKTELY